MLTSKQRADLRSRSNTLDTTLMVGKDGVTDNVTDQARRQLAARELIKGRVLETALLSAREVSDELCRRTGAEGVATVGSKFVIYKKSEKLAQEAALKAKREKKAAANPVRKGAQARRKAAQAKRDERDEYFRQAAIQAAIDKRKAKKQQEQD